MNRLFLTAITGECCLYQLHGIRPKGYNPFTLFCNEIKRLTNGAIKISPKNHKAVFEQIRHIYKENNMTEHAMLKEINP